MRGPGPLLPDPEPTRQEGSTGGPQPPVERPHIAEYERVETPCSAVASVGWDMYIDWFWVCPNCNYRGAGYPSAEEALEWMLRHTTPEPIPMPEGPDPLAPDPKAPALFHEHAGPQHRAVVHKHENWWVPHDHGSLRPFEDWTYVPAEDVGENFPDDYVYCVGRTKHIKDETDRPTPQDMRQRALCGAKGHLSWRKRNQQLLPVCKRCERIAKKRANEGGVDAYEPVKDTNVASVLTGATKVHSGGAGGTSARPASLFDPLDIDGSTEGETQ